jgi:hypothetical protein
VVKITLVDALETDANNRCGPFSSGIKQFQQGGKYPVVVVVDVEPCSILHHQERPYPKFIKASAPKASDLVIYVLCGMVYEESAHFAAELYKPGISFVYDSMSKTFAGKDFVMAERLQTECQQSGEKRPSLLIYAQVNACLDL